MKRNVVMHIQGWSATDVGKVRDVNQDAVLVEPDRGVFAVADGIGGKPEGAGASAAAVEAIREELDDLEALLEKTQPAGRHRERACDFLVEQFKRINRKLYDRAGGDMGTTCDLLALGEGVGFVGHVGDSRVYLIRGGRIHKLTDDHTFAEKIRKEQQRMGEPDDFRLDARYDHVLTRSLGGQPEVDVDTLFIDVQPGDRFLLCTDGVTDVLGDEQLVEADASYDAPELAAGLVEAARDAETQDNTTVVVASVPGSTSPDFDAAGPVDTLRKVSFLEQIDMFEDLDSRELLRVLRIVYKESYTAGETILERGGAPRRMYMILEGEVELRVEDHEVARLKAGEHFGEMALFGGHPRSADAVAADDVILLAVPSDQFRQLVEVEDVELGNKLLRNLLNRAAARIRDTTRSLLDAREGSEAKAEALGRADTLEIDSDAIDLEAEIGADES